MARDDSLRRGGGWVAGQVVLLGIFAVIAPYTRALAPSLLTKGIATAVMAAGILVAVWAALRLGRSLTPFPKPVAEGRLCREGPYRWVRHPIYGAVLLLAIGWAAWWQSVIAAALVPVIFLFFALKARAEERWLTAAYPDYPEYAKQVKALVPFIY